MADQDTIDAIHAVAAEFELEPALLLAVAEIESGLRPFAAIGSAGGGRREPLIRFEGHYFDRRLSTELRAAARRAGLAAPEAGAVPNPASQDARWRLLDRAAAIDRKAAFESVSWGLGQVMGAHWAWLGYADVDALVAEARRDAAGQTRLMARYIVKAGLAGAALKRDWPAFARGYNGPAYRANRYDTRLAAAFRRHMATVPETGGSVILRRGDRGPQVAELQRALAAAGHPLDIDGAFGPLTAEAVSRFQAQAGLPPDGIADETLRRALAAELSFGRRLAKLWQLLRDLAIRAVRA